MKYNNSVENFSEYVDKINKESEIQERYNKKIKDIKNKIIEIEQEIEVANIETQKNRLFKLIGWYNEDIKKCMLEIEQSKKRQKLYRQKVCAHDFGIISLEYKGIDGKTYQSGFCLDCDLEINEMEGPLFTHSFKMSDVISPFTFNDYKVKLSELKRISDYENNDNDYIIGEKIKDEMIKIARGDKKKN